jgi:radical SAM superfamily enzyme YgiQ (UPF0313 family)
MARALLIVPHFWDPVCVPLGISSLKAYAARFGHCVELFDFNVVSDVFSAQRAYFVEGRRQFPYWSDWNIERNGTEMLAIHQILYLFARNRPDYRELVAEVLNQDGRDSGVFADRLDVSRFDAIFAALYAHVFSILKERLAATRPDVVGCSLMNSTWPATLFLLNRVKGLQPSVRTVVGGPGPLMGLTARRQEVEAFVRRHECIDYFVIGEGERPFVEILDEPELPRGIIDRDRAVRRVEAKKALLPVSDIPTPDYGALDVSKYLQLSVAGTRGCPFQCSFCAETLFWKGYRSQLGSHTFQQMHSLAEKHRRTAFYLCDSLSNPTIGSLTAEIRRSGESFTIDCYLRPDATAIDRSEIRSWKAGGLVRARLGMESANSRILDAMVKKTTPALMAQSVDALAAEEVVTSTLWILCYPGETEHEFLETIDFIRRHRSTIYQADAWLFQYHPEGLAQSAVIDRERGSKRRFSETINEILALSPYVVDRDLSAAERFHRLETFVRTMRELDVPNPYSVYEWLDAEERWKSLGHGNEWTVEKNMMALNA